MKDSNLPPKQYRSAKTQLERNLESHASARILLRIEHMAGIRPHALLRSALVRVKALGLRKVQRYAVVGGPMGPYIIIGERAGRREDYIATRRCHGNIRNRVS